MSDEEKRASTNPMICMIDESTWDKYMRAVGQKGIGEGTEMMSLIRDMSMELKAWGHPGGSVDNQLIMKCDNETSIMAVRDALARFHGGRVVPERPPKGESQSNGAVEEAGKTVRE